MRMLLCTAMLHLDQSCSEPLPGPESELLASANAYCTEALGMEPSLSKEAAAQVKKFGTVARLLCLQATAQKRQGSPLAALETYKRSEKPAKADRMIGTLDQQMIAPLRR